MKTSGVVVVLLAVIISACGDEPAEPRNPHLHHVSATVSGLAGEGLVLGLEGETLQIPYGGEYAFRTMLGEGSRVNVSVAAEPSHPGQTCVVTGSGVVMLSRDINVQVECTTLNFSVGGTVSGLTGVVALELNGHSQQLTKDGPFKFKTPLPDGSSYSVHISAQPSYQWCEIAGGSGWWGGTSGTLDGANVNSIAVICQNTYSVVFTIAGAKGLVGLAFNSQAYAGSENGTWQFGESLFDGDPYEVIITESPPGQSCVVTNGVGTVMGANVTDVMITCTDL